mmetsp:Transcript_79151/g.256622  ORF Transcript_79151/g.256622 Transcript_79151/m.256622 type:complete len:304 (-) Transcript_79151:196-1107(-)
MVRHVGGKSGGFVLLAVALVCVMQMFPRFSPQAPGLAMVTGGEDSSFMTKVVGAAAQGATAATVAAILSAVTEPIVNRLLVKRMTFAQASAEITFSLVSNFFLTTFPTNMLKFPVFEVINIVLSFTSLSGGMRGIVNGFLFCSVMLPVTNYRFRKSMGWEVNPALLYQAYIPTVTRDIIYGWARGFVGAHMTSAFAPETSMQRAVCFGATVLAACIISSPGNEWRGYTLQPKDRTLPFAEYFKPVNYMRSTGVGATIMGIALMVGMLVTPYAEMLFAYLKGHLFVAGGLVVLMGVLAGAISKK